MGAGSGAAGDRRSSRRRRLALAGVLAAGAAGLVIGLDPWGIREKLLGPIGRPRITSIAVLPLENLSGKQELGYLARGMTEELSYDLSLIGTFDVIASSSTARYRDGARPLPDVARELDVDGVIQGGVQRIGDRVRVSLVLSHAPSERRLWERTFERELGEVPILLAEVARAVTGEIGARLEPEQDTRLSASRPVNPRALEAYLRASYGDEKDPEASLQQAIELDSGFAMPFASLAASHYWSNFLPRAAPRDTYPKVKDAVRRALAIDRANAPAHFYAALIAWEYDWNLADSEREFRQNLQLRNNCADTHHMYAHFLLSVDRVDEAKVETARALRINPQDPGLVACACWHDVVTGEPENAQKRCATAVGMGAAGPLVHVWTGWAYQQGGKVPEAIAEFQKAVVTAGEGVFFMASLGHAYAAAGRTLEAREVLDKLLARSKTEYVSPYELAVVYAGLGDRDRAFEWLDKAFDDRATFLARHRMDPRNSTLRSDARFQSLVRRMRLSEGGD